MYKLIHKLNSQINVQINSQINLRINSQMKVQINSQIKVQKTIVSLSIVSLVVIVVIPADHYSPL